MTASQALTAGLLKRAKTGKGSYIELSMLDALIQFAWAEGFSRETFQHGMDNTREYVRDMIFETNKGYITAGAVQDNEWVGMCNDSASQNGLLMKNLQLLLLEAKTGNYV